MSIFCLNIIYGKIPRTNSIYLTPIIHYTPGNRVDSILILSCIKIIISHRSLCIVIFWIQSGYVFTVLIVHWFSHLNSIHPYADRTPILRYCFWKRGKCPTEAYIITSTDALFLLRCINSAKRFYAVGIITE